ncbi:MAG TPA: hypothetical protein VF746_31205 [Longimicrobium sp.]|jgi:hypothetical protein
MPSRSDYYRDTLELRRKPTAARWEDEIQRVLYGQREHALVELGSSEEYVESLLQRSEDVVTAQRIFRKALNRLVRGWDPDAPCPEHYVPRMLELIAAYLPPSGFTRVLGQIRRKGHFTVPGARDPAALHMDALVALARYFPAPPQWPDEHSSFWLYVEVLRSHLFQQEYAQYVVARLLELNELHVDGEDVHPLLMRNLSVLHPILAFVLSPLVRTRGDTDQVTVQKRLSHIFSECVRLGAEARGEFARGVEENGCTFEELPSQVFVRWEHDVVLELDIPRELQQAYFLGLPQEASTEREFEQLLNAIIAIEVEERPAAAEPVLNVYIP